MPTSTAILSLLHLVLLAIFVSVTSVSMLVGLISRVRIRRPKLVWRTGPFNGIPIGPSLFLGAAVAGLIVAGAFGSHPSLPLLLGYPMGGLFWWIAVWLARAVVVTEYGVIPDVTRISSAVAWSQVSDYFVAERNGQTQYTFFYTDADTGRRERLNLTVPSASLPAFETVVHRKLDARFAFSDTAAVDEETMDPR